MTLKIVMMQPYIEVMMKVLQGSVERRPQRGAKKLVFDRLLKALDKTVGMRVFNRRHAVLDAVFRQTPPIRFRLNSEKFATILSQDFAGLEGAVSKERYDLLLHQSRSLR